MCLRIKQSSILPSTAPSVPFSAPRWHLWSLKKKGVRRGIGRPESLKDKISIDGKEGSKTRKESRPRA